jgi:hypothetical protein
MTRRFMMLLALVPTLSMAAVVQAPVVKNSAGQPIEATPVITVDQTGTYVAGGGGGGGGGGGSVSATSTAAAPSYTEGSTTSPLSMTLTGDLRTITKFVGTPSVNISSYPTFGTPADTPWDGVFSNPSFMSIAKAQLLNQISGSSSPVTIDQTTQGTTNGVVVKSSALPTGAALETGGNLATIATNTAAGASRVVTGPVASLATAAGNPVPVGGTYNSTAPTVPAGARNELQINAKGFLQVAISAANTPGADNVSNTSNIVQVARNDGVAQGLLAVAPSNYTGSGWDRLKIPNAACRIVSAAASTNSTSCKTSSAEVFQVEAYNTSASVKFLKIYNKASPATVGTDTPVLTIALPPTARTTMTLPSPYYLGTGLAIAVTGAANDNDTTALTAGDVVALNVLYQ